MNGKAAHRRKTKLLCGGHLVLVAILALATAGRIGWWGLAPALIIAALCCIAQLQTMGRLSRTWNHARRTIPEAAAALAREAVSLADANEQLLAVFSPSDRLLDITANRLSIILSSGEAIAAAADNCDRTVVSARKCRGLVQNLESDLATVSDTISSAEMTLQAVDEIAIKTRLLAVNAAIQASRAGEAGKGFAVVAEEIGQLSELSSQASRDSAHQLASGRCRCVECRDRCAGAASAMRLLCGSAESALSAISGAVAEQVERDRELDRIRDDLERSSRRVPEERAALGAAASSGHVLAEKARNLAERFSGAETAMKSPTTSAAAAPAPVPSSRIVETAAEVARKASEICGNPDLAEEKDSVDAVPCR